MPRRSKPAEKTVDTDRWMQLDHQLCFALYATSLAMTKLYKAMLAPLGLTYPQYLVLLALWQQNELSVGDLGERLCLDSGTLTPLLKRMEAAGLLQRQRAADDERRVLVSLAPAGVALRSLGSQVPRQIGAAIGCTPDEALALTQRLQRLRSQLQATLEPPSVSPTAAARKVAVISHPSATPPTEGTTPWPPPKKSSTPPTPLPPAAAKARRSLTTARSTSS